MDDTPASLAEAFLRHRRRCTVGAHALTGDQLRFLTALANMDAPTMISAVGWAAGMNRHRASLASAALQEGGLIRRKADKTDLRLRLMELTREGRAVCDKLAKMLP